MKQYLRINNVEIIGLSNYECGQYVDNISHPIPTQIMYHQKDSVCNLQATRLKLMFSKVKKWKNFKFKNNSYINEHLSTEHRRIFVRN